MTAATPPPDDEATTDSTDRMADVTDSWQSSPLTDPDGATDPAIKGPVEHGDDPGPADAGSAAEAQAQRPDF